MRKRFKIKKLIRNNRYTFLSKGEEKNLLANEMSLQILGGGQLCASHQYLYVMLNLFQHLATVELHRYSKRLPQRRNIGQTLNQHPATGTSASNGQRHLAGSQKKTGASNDAPYKYLSQGARNKR